MSISDRMQNDGLSFEEACMKESLTMPSSTEALLNERGKTHGDFAITARIATGLKHVLDPRDHLPDVQREALDLICTKIARIMAGDSQCADHWDDIAGYAKLVSQDLQREKTPADTAEQTVNDVIALHEKEHGPLTPEQRDAGRKVGLDYLRRNPPFPGAHVAQYQVQCRCGWSGMQGQLRWNMPKARYECPLCREEFKNFFIPGAK